MCGGYDEGFSRLCNAFYGNWYFAFIFYKRFCGISIYSAAVTWGISFVVQVLIGFL